MASGHNSKRHDSTGKLKCESYRNSKRRERNKIKRILQSNGYNAALEYSHKHGIHMPKVKAVAA